MQFLASLLSLFVLMALTAQQDELEDALPENPDPAVTARELSHHVHTLASDAMEGRAMATPGSARAARYLAAALQAAGAEPCGDDDSFFQRVPLVRDEHQSVPRLIFTTKMGEEVEGTYGVDFTVTVRGEARSTGVLGIRRVAKQKELPRTAEPGEALFMRTTPRKRRSWLELYDMEDARGWGLELQVSSSDKVGNPKSAPATRTLRADTLEEDRVERVIVRGPLKERLVWKEFESVQLLFDVERTEIPEANVVGRIPGTDAGREHEVVLLSAHYDHIGVREFDRAGKPLADPVFNGADDDASGCALLLELAQALAAEPSARPIVFFFAAGEEQGLVGTRYYLDHPLFPLEQTVANLNFEMVGRPDAAAGGQGKLWLTGFERSNLGALFSQHGLGIVADPHPEKHFFQRSDNYAFALRGVVAQSLSSYGLHDDYHRASDEADTLDYEHLEAVTRHSLKAVRLLGSGELQPAWNPDGQPRPTRSLAEGRRGQDSRDEPNEPSPIGTEEGEGQ